MSNLSNVIEQLAAAICALPPYAHTAKDPFTRGYVRDLAQESQPNGMRPADWRRFTLRCERVAALEIGGLGQKRYAAELRLETRYPSTLGGERQNAYFGAEIEGLRVLLETAACREDGALVYGELLDSELLVVDGGLIFSHRLLVHYDHSGNGALHE